MTDPIQSLRQRACLSPILQMFDGLQLLFSELDSTGVAIAPDHPLVTALRDVVSGAEQMMAEKRENEELRCPYCEREWPQ